MASPESHISRGALRKIFLGEDVQEPVLQCLQIKKLNKKDEADPDRFRTVLSDIDHFIQSMLGSHLNELVHQDKLEMGRFVRVKSFQTSEIKGKKIMVVLDCEVLEELGLHEKIGVPAALEGAISGAKDEDLKSETTSTSNGISGNNFYGANSNNGNNGKQESQRSVPMRSGGPSGSGGPNSSSRGNIHPIEAISPYSHNWTIKARCTSKGEIKKWHKQSGEGKLFSCNFLDETDEIRATAFNNECDMFYDVIQEGGVYYISTCQVKLANKRFSNLKNDYELTFERGTVVEKAEDEDSVPKVKYNFTTLADVQNVDKDSTIDTIAVLQSADEVSQIVSKTTQKPYDKRDLTLVDNSGFSIRLTIWGNSATTFDVRPEQVIAFKGVKVSDFNGRSLSLLSSGSMTPNPDLDEAFRLKGWYDAQGRNDSFTSHATVLGTSGSGGRREPYKTIGAIRAENIGMSEQVEYFTMKCTVVYIKHDGTLAYPACRSEGCNKKVVESMEGQWTCERCSKDWDKPEWRYILSANVSDHTGSIWVTCFNETGQQVFGMTADELIGLKETDNGRFLATVEAANFQTWIFRCKAKLETFQEQERVRYQVSSAQPVNFGAEANRLAEIIKQYNIDDDNSLFVR